MLQQTTTKTVEPYFKKFVTRFKNVGELAKSSFDDVLVMWQGLGYYRRAKNLHESAKVIHSLYAGNVPDTKEKLLALPGIGSYTCHAILAIGYNKPFLPLDGNIKRVFARYFGLDAPYSQLDKAINALNFDVGDNAKDFCEGLMDFANKVCLSQNPLCHSCPLADKCKAFNEKLDLPRKNKKPIKRVLYISGALFCQDSCVVLVKGTTEGLLPFLWNIPFIEEPKGNFLGSVRHIFSHIDLHVKVYHVDEKPEGTLVPLSDLSQYALSRLAQKCLALLPL